MALGPDQVLLRGAKLQNTNWIFGQVVYTGHETKLLKNSTAAPLKRSTVDKLTNTQIIMLFILLILVAFISALFSVVIADNTHMKYVDSEIETESGEFLLMSFIFVSTKIVKFCHNAFSLSNNLISWILFCLHAGFWKTTLHFLYNVLTFVILYNNLIPISLTVTLEVVRFIQVCIRMCEQKHVYDERC